MQTGKKDLMWGYITQFLRWGNGLILLPVILRMLPSEQLAFWYLFASIASMVLLFDFGFSPTIQRNITYVFSGAQKLFPKGIERIEDDEDEQINEINPKLLKQMMYSARAIYAIISFATFIIISSIGSYYISTIIEQNSVKNIIEIWISWGIVVLKSSLDFYYLYLNTFLRGRGYVMQAQKAAIVSTVIMILLSFIGLNLGYGLISLVSASFISVAINRFMSKRYFYDTELSTILSKANEKVTFEEKKSTIEILWYNAKRVGTSSLGTFIITRVGQLFVTSFFTLTFAAQYGLTMQLIGVIATLAGTYISTMYPRITHDYFKNNLVAVRRHFGIAAVMVLLIYLFGCIGLLTVGEVFLRLIGSQTELLPSWQVAFIFLIYFLDTQYVVFSNIHTIGNTVPFVKPTIYSGVAITSISFLLLKFTTPSLWTLLLVQFIVQASYNNWKWPYDACKILDISYFGFYREGFSAIKRQINNAINT